MNNFKEAIVAFAEAKKLSNRELSIILNTRESTLESWLYSGVTPSEETQKEILSYIQGIEQCKTCDGHVPLIFFVPPFER